VAPEKALVLKPAQISFEEAASLPIAGITAFQALRDKGNIQKLQKVLIVGSSGGVGTFAIQLAKYFGAGVTAVCSTKNVEQPISLGADHVIDYTKEHITKKYGDFDLILAVNGNYPLNTYRRVLNPGGICVMVGGTLSQISTKMTYNQGVMKLRLL
jgi:NADPH:quinone reductase-like Zn-dependent oxidoreductase